MSKTKEEILKDRAQILSQIISEDKNNEDKLNIVVFMLGSETYGVETKYIKEIYPLKDLAYIPGLPRFIKGVINVRRKIYSVMDLRTLFEIEEGEATNETKALILENNDVELVIIADQIVGIQIINSQFLKSSLPTITETREEYLLGVTQEGIILLDGQMILSDKKIIISDTV